MALRIIIGLIVAYTVLFLARPEMDLELHRHLYQNGTFYLAQKWWIVGFYDLIPWITRAVVVGCVLLLLREGLRRKLHKAALVLLLSLALGPGLLVNGIFKEFSGRARPSQIVEFGGTKNYTPPIAISDQCMRNCSFVSGHASVGFLLAAFALFFHRRTKTMLYSLGVAFGLWNGFVRMAMGGHFFSDIVFAGLFTLLVVHLVYYAVYLHTWHSISRNS